MTARMRPCLLVHYHEISLKGGNRPLFLRHLVRNLERVTADLGPSRVVQLPGRIMVDLEAHPDPLAALARARKVCGIANLAVAYRVSPTLDALKSTVARLVEGRQFPSFRISARRAFKTYPLTSVELNRELGSFVLERVGTRAGGVSTRVDLENPALNIHVEVLPHEAFVYTDREPGPGGLPVGVSGTVLALLSGGFDSPVAAWRMMKRGCRVVFVHFHSAPYLPVTSQEKARRLVERLTEWQYFSRLFLAPFGEIQREVVLSVPPPGRVVVYRRLMVRIAEALARAVSAQALVTGESLGQVASQTLANLSRINEVATLSILRPLIGMDKQEIAGEARRLGTFEI
ncbi:MAG: tRNA 4-thiouridine(8) synthase ThiI, partial [Candidatus Rokubacteria bacterium]|nr:tRNA 4-thiouridine(8) synthase ThiI [Candidatus Rokubacteria bacterium]